MLDWLQKLWSKEEAFKNGLALTLFGEETYVIEGYFAAQRGDRVNPYFGKKAEWWQMGQDNYLRK